MIRLTWLLGLILVACSLAGCARTLGYAGQHPGYVSCKGKGTISGQGGAMAGAGIAGGELNSFSLVADCGDGFELTQGKPAPVAPAK